MSGFELKRRDFLGAATGLLAGINAARLVTGEPTATAPRATMLGALCHYISHADSKSYQPWA